MKTIIIGILSQDKMRARAVAIAKGEHKPKPGEPRIWFPSMRPVVKAEEFRILAAA